VLCVCVCEREREREVVLCVSERGANFKKGAIVLTVNFCDEFAPLQSFGFFALGGGHL